MGARKKMIMEQVFSAVDLKKKQNLMEQLEGCVKNRNGASVNVADDTADDSETAACTKA